MTSQLPERILPCNQEHTEILNLKTRIYGNCHGNADLRRTVIACHSLLSTSFPAVLDTAVAFAGFALGNWPQEPAVYDQKS